MNYTRRYLSCLLPIFLATSVIPVQAQEYFTGAVFNPKTISETPMKVNLSFRSFAALPTSYSLEPYAPTPGNQGKHGTCVAFANGYGIATILYAKTHNLTDKRLIDKYAFSPTFLYEQIKQPNDQNCQNGADPITAIRVMIKSGEALMSTVPYLCGAPVGETAKSEAVNYKLKDAALLFAAKGQLTVDDFVKTPEQIISITKKALSEGTPISGGFTIPKSFFTIRSAVWTSDPSEVNENWQHNGHAMAVVGYDDNIAGGAFRVLNSWGNTWADGGYVWMKYADFARYCVMALQVFADPNTLPPKENTPPAPSPSPSPSPQPKPEPKPEPGPKPQPAPEKTFALSGNIEFKLNTGEDMPVTKISTRNLTVEDDTKPEKEDLVAYTMRQTYTSGTRFRFYMNNDEEAYIYAFATDLGGKVNLILPFADNISTHVGKNSTIAFPSDTKVVQMDDQKGSDFLLILYSAEKLDAPALAAKMNGMKGAISTKIKTVLGNKLIDKAKIQYKGDQAGFSTKGHSTRNLTVEDDSKAPTTGSVVPLMIEIKHQ
jgi:hypothetical protein